MRTLHALICTRPDFLLVDAVIQERNLPIIITGLILPVYFADALLVDRGCRPFRITPTRASDSLILWVDVLRGLRSCQHVIVTLGVLVSECASQPHHLRIFLISFRLIRSIVWFMISCDLPHVLPEDLADAALAFVEEASRRILQQLVLEERGLVHLPLKRFEAYLIPWRCSSMLL